MRIVVCAVANPGPQETSKPFVLTSRTTIKAALWLLPKLPLRLLKGLEMNRADAKHLQALGKAALKEASKSGAPGFGDVPIHGAAVRFRPYFESDWRGAPRLPRFDRIFWGFTGGMGAFVIGFFAFAAMLSTSLMFMTDSTGFLLVAAASLGLGVLGFCLAMWELEQVPEDAKL